MLSNNPSQKAAETSEELEILRALMIIRPARKGCTIHVSRFTRKVRTTDGMMKFCSELQAHQE